MFTFQLQATDARARAGIFHTPHGNIQTPVFMPVGTKSTVKGISNEDLDEMGAQIILNNTYHLYLRPGDEVVKYFWGIHGFSGYQKPMLTDSGWFQVFSLGQTGNNGFKNKQSLVKITDDGVYFRSYIDGSKHYFSAENVMNIQSNLWADIIMAFDECAPGNSSYQYAQSAMNRTHAWAKRSLEQVKKNNEIRKNDGRHEQTLFPIIQGVIYDDLRIESAKFVSEMDTSGIAIGWLSVGESKEDMYRTLDVIEPYMIPKKPRYLMGVGTPEDLVEGIYRWVDMFDCVLPTRIGRHGTAFSRKWYVKIKSEKYRLSDEPLCPDTDNKVCKKYSKWYLRHLIQENEILGMQLLSYHNLHFLIDLANRAREAIFAGKYDEFRADFWREYELPKK